MRVIVPVAFATQLLHELGGIRAISPLFEPVMTLLGLPPELALAWLTGLLVGIWGGLVIVFTLVPVTDLSTADVTVFSVLLLFAHAVPIEQQIIKRAGPSLLVTATVRIGGGLLFAVLLHQVLAVTGWLSDPATPSWTPADAGVGWIGFLARTAQMLGMMLAMLLALSWLMELLRISGILDRMNRALAPIFWLAGIDARTVPFAAIGLLLGITYGGGLLIREARTGEIEPRQIFLACAFMGLAHSIIEDTLVVVAFGADLTSVLVARLAFAVFVTAMIARLIYSIPDRLFYRLFYNGRVDRFGRIPPSFPHNRRPTTASRC
ncbi:nucleoside recognition domain-containing protein [Arenibaculum pallidiluteum]|uniref:nucleoside recognition domain-containing protein n=1 Tax=Arenibaculum pallidiluteum TaxID=2812559 RepID=UPI001A9797D0|nr:nucleoside recognition domain-containing protein [Arenibaculum pallidiluteum]